MSNAQTITIKLKPHLQEYLRCKLGDDIAVSSKNIIGALMAPFLEYTPKNYIQPKLNKKHSYMTLELKDGIGGKRIYRGVYISEKNQRSFQRSLDSHFNDLFFSYMEDKMRYFDEQKKCILQFCSDYKFTFEDITYEMLRKRYQRRMNLNNAKSVHKMSRTCPLIFLL